MGRGLEIKGALSLSKLQDSLHREVLFENNQLQLGSPRESLGGMVKVPKYTAADLPESMANDFGHVTGADFLKGNFQRIQSRLVQEYGQLSPQERVEAEAFKAVLTELPLFHATRAPIESIVELNGALSYERYKRVDDGCATHNTTSSDVEIGRDKFVYLSLGNLYLGGNNSEARDLTVLVVKGENLRDPKFVVQSDGLNKLAILHNEEQTKEWRDKGDFRYLNQTTLQGDDFLEVASYCLAKKILSYSDFNRSEVMIRDVLPVEQIDRCLIGHEGIGEPLSSGLSIDGRTMEVSYLPEAQVYALQFDATTNQAFETRATELLARP